MKKIYKSALLILFLSILLNGCGDNELSCSDCNIVFVSFDALQAAHTHSFGYSKDITPTIDSIADSGYKFTNAISASSWTVPASMTWFTGIYPSQHKVTNKFSKYTKDEKVLSNLKKLSPDVMTLAEVLKQNGYATAGFTGDAGVNGVFGFNQGFDTYFDNTTPFSGMEVSSPKALEWLKQNKDKKFFLFLHGYDFHGQYEPEEGFDYRYVNFDYKGPYNGSRQQQGALREEGLEKGTLTLTDDDVQFWRAIYDEKINRADAKFAEFLAEYKKLGLMDKTIFILTSDHGTEFYEHKRFDHGATLYDELIHIPLIIKLPNQHEGKVINNQVSSIDIMPTILGLAGIKLDDKIKRQMMGTSLTMLMDGKEVKKDVYFETDYRHYTYKRGIRTPDGWKYVYTMEDEKEELYNLDTDSTELENLATKEPRVAYELKQKLFKWMQDTGQDASGKWELDCLPVYDVQCKNV